MDLEVKRIAYRPTYTIGKLYINGTYFCDVLEDVDRGLTDSMSVEEILKIKVKGQTAIPKGTYYINMNVVSPKYYQIPFYKKLCNGQLPRLLMVKGFDGILLHCGTTHMDSSGCLLIGRNKEVGKVLESRATFEKLMKEYLLPAYNRKETIKITIS